ncbi:MAG: DNA gyrase subunit A, partial [Clostridia bacterium]|nr:DNA gyrase subunit A [Clostridia bacterium]
GYIKRMPVDEYRAQRRGGLGVTAHKTKEEDFVDTVFATNTHVPVLFFSNKGKVYRIKGWQIPEAGKNSKGRAMINLLNLEDGEKINAYIPMPADSSGYLMMATRDGLIKKTDVSEFARIQNNGKIAITLTDGDELIGVQLTGGEDEILMASTGGKCIRFSESTVRATGRTSMGVKSIKLDKDEVVVDMTKVCDGAEVFTLTQNGYGKRTDISEYSLQGRAGKGLKAGTLTEKTGNIVNLKLINPETDDVIIIADNGIIIRVHADEISKIGRATQGVKVMRLKAASAKVVACAVVPRAADEEEVPEQVEEGAEHPQNTADSADVQTDNNNGAQE